MKYILLRNKKTKEIEKFGCPQGEDYEELNKEETKSYESQELQEKRLRLKDIVKKNKNKKILEKLIKKDTSLDSPEIKKYNEIDNTPEEELDNLNLEF